MLYGTYSLLAVVASIHSPSEKGHLLENFTRPMVLSVVCILLVRRRPALRRLERLLWSRKGTREGKDIPASEGGPIVEGVRYGSQKTTRTRASAAGSRP